MYELTKKGQFVRVLTSKEAKLLGVEIKTLPKTKIQEIQNAYKKFLKKKLKIHSKKLNLNIEIGFDWDLGHEVSWFLLGIEVLGNSFINNLFKEQYLDFEIIDDHPDIEDEVENSKEYKAYVKEVKAFIESIPKEYW